MMNKVSVIQESTFSIVFQYQTVTATAAKISIESTEIENCLM